MKITAVSLREGPFNWAGAGIFHLKACGPAVGPRAARAGTEARERILGRLRPSDPMKFIESAKSVKPIGPYSQGVATNGLVFVSGQIAIDPATNAVVKGGIREQTKRALDSLQGILEAGGSGLDKVVKVTVFIKDISYFKDMNEVYAAAFGSHKPARSTVVCGFVKDEILVEIEAIATQ
jgi:2-iminobutanoate/2-iminopropanoate deaminase